LSSRLSGATYEATINGFILDQNRPHSIESESLKEEISQSLAEILAASTFIVQTPPEKTGTRHDTKHDTGASKQSEKDLRPLIKDLQIIEQNPLTLELKLAHGSRGHIKPTDILSNLRLPSASSNAPLRWKLKRIALHAEDGADLYAI
jgi:hypothetical protein